MAVDHAAVTATHRPVLTYGTHAVLVECAGTAEAIALAERVSAEFDEVVETIPGARTVLVRCARPVHDQLRRRLSTVPVTVTHQHPTRTIEIGVAYDGPDLLEVAGLCGLDVEQVIAAHTGQTWRVAFCGFAPGFAYLQGDDERLTVPRRSTPRAEVAAGSVALADTWSSVYPRRAPGGWQLIGSTSASLWDAARTPPALLGPGVAVRFVDLGARP
ncbi:MAG: allophanate hydrolase subunit 1 [Propionibacteriales bacterium]|nr:allophanate hydrolase subunit 1 [Propionibacteriales bacterium]